MQRALLLPVDSAAPVTATVTQQVESLLPHLSLLLAIDETRGTRASPFSRGGYDQAQGAPGR